MRRSVAHKNLVPTTKVNVTVEDQRFVIYKSCVSKNNKGNSMKLLRKVKQNKKVCRAQNFDSHDQGQGRNQRSKVCHLQSCIHNNS